MGGVMRVETAPRTMAGPCDAHSSPSRCIVAPFAGRVMAGPLLLPIHEMSDPTVVYRVAREPRVKSALKHAHTSRSVGCDGPCVTADVRLSSSFACTSAISAGVHRRSWSSMSCRSSSWTACESPPSGAAFVASSTVCSALTTSFSAAIAEAACASRRAGGHADATWRRRRTRRRGAPCHVAESSLPC